MANTALELYTMTRPINSSNASAMRRIESDP